MILHVYKTVPKNLIWSESAQWLLSSDIRKISGALITPMDTPIMPPWAHDHAVAYLQAKTVPMNLIWSESAQWLLSSGVQDSRSPYHVPGMAIMPPWANDHGVAHLQACTVPMNLIWSESAHWLLSYGIRKIPGTLITPTGMPITPPMGTSTGQHGSKEFDSE